ncbi:helix-turn-helix domain-containing protein [Asticcacaulis endophyticus]|uniref:HTH cro/C1-type domain-containing protein n=1 Tax=Asticcacaulis endophyticus TaxID=1395890 RepID=A0A918Q4W0_9CAUL|nr:helix-turn-helix transcriptional regulator [Asticcacaulis endophyticus]GGZ31880.1 hypothetical protein GCM10011273_17360 [Asticcacaulis endophyticus]
MTTPKTKAPARVDLAVGANVRRLRKARGWSQEKLADAIELTFQQVQKYERGSNRISASKLFDIALALECSLEDLFPPRDWQVRLTEGGTWVEEANTLSANHPHLFEALCRLKPGQVEILLATARNFVTPLQVAV